MINIRHDIFNVHSGAYKLNRLLEKISFFFRILVGARASQNRLKKGVKRGVLTKLCGFWADAPPRALNMARFRLLTLF